MEFSLEQKQVAVLYDYKMADEVFVGEAKVGPTQSSLPDQGSFRKNPWLCFGEIQF